ncbi:membrane protein [Rhodopirellula maiorica SM1]|uniref:Membrane protein n=1 Tax=Rhodopirellula maiorica SM1 TaxID=1265738 RepID=M5RC72_9BACT|nr:membrane protein [Rhodopirellula maiorica SM1]
MSTQLARPISSWASLSFDIDPTTDRLKSMVDTIRREEVTCAARYSRRCCSSDDLICTKSLRIQAEIALLRQEAMLKSRAEACQNVHAETLPPVNPLPRIGTHMTPPFYSVKRSDHWKWDGRFSSDELLAKIQDEGLGSDWHVAPFATDESPVDACVFARDPDIFVRRFASREEAARHRKEIANSVAPPQLLIWGRRGLSAFFAFLLLGRGTITIFFPQLRGAGLTPMAWMLLVPAWTIGGISVFAYAIGAWQHKKQVAIAIGSESTQT